MKNNEGKRVYRASLTSRSTVINDVPMASMHLPFNNSMTHFRHTFPSLFLELHQADVVDQTDVVAQGEVSSFEIVMHCALPYPLILVRFRPKSP